MTKDKVLFSEGNRYFEEVSLVEWNNQNGGDLSIDVRVIARDDSPDIETSFDLSHEKALELYSALGKWLEKHKEI